MALPRSDHFKTHMLCLGFPGGSAAKSRPANSGDAGDAGSIPGREDPLEKETATPNQYSCLENPMDRGTWWATVRGVTISWT